MSRATKELQFGRNAPTTPTAYSRFSRYMLDFSGGQGVNRTLDTRIFSPLLYRLSYLPTVFVVDLLFTKPTVRERSFVPVIAPPRNGAISRTKLLRCHDRASPATRDSTKSITLPSRLTPSSRSISCTPVGLVTFTSVR